MMQSSIPFPNAKRETSENRLKTLGNLGKENESKYVYFELNTGGENKNLSDRRGIMETPYIHLRLVKGRYDFLHRLWIREEHHPGAGL